MVSIIREHTSPEKGEEPYVWKGKLSLQTCHIRCKCSMETSRNFVKVKFNTKAIKSG